MKVLPRTLLAIVFAAVATVPAGRAQTVSPQPAPTIITSAPYTINAPGYYQLGADLVVSNTSGHIIFINSGNVTLDFAGHYISGPNSTPASTLNGVYCNEHGNLRILNGTIAYCEEGIYLNGNGTTTSLNINHRIENMLVSYCYHDGILLFHAKNSTVKNCAVSFIGGTSQATDANGINLTYGTTDTVDSCTVTNVDSTGGNSLGVCNTGGVGGTASNNTASNITVNGSLSGNVNGPSAGVVAFAFARGNNIYNAYYGILAVAKYQNNLTYGCTVPFDANTDAGGNF